jgi:hypothetical protein
MSASHLHTSLLCAHHKICAIDCVCVIKCLIVALPEQFSNEFRPILVKASWWVQFHTRMTSSVCFVKQE